MQDAGIAPPAGLGRQYGVRAATGCADAFKIKACEACGGVCRNGCGGVVRIQRIEMRHIARRIAVAVVRHLAEETALVRVAVTVAGAVADEGAQCLFVELLAILAPALFGECRVGLVVSGAIEEQAQAQRDADVLPFFLGCLFRQLVVSGRASRAHGGSGLRPERGGACCGRAGGGLFAVDRVVQRRDEGGTAGATADAVQAARQQSTAALDERDPPMIV